MASSGNIATWNPLDDDRTTVTFLQGNLFTNNIIYNCNVDISDN